jgi:hypothetical protein
MWSAVDDEDEEDEDGVDTEDTGNAFAVPVACTDFG